MRENARHIPFIARNGDSPRIVHCISKTQIFIQFIFSHFVGLRVIAFDPILLDWVLAVADVMRERFVGAIVNLIVRT